MDSAREDNVTIKEVKAELIAELPEQFSSLFPKVTTFLCPDTWNGHSIGQWIGSICEDGRKRSALVADGDGSEMFDRLRESGVLKGFCHTRMDRTTLNMLKCEDYYIIRRVLGHSSTLPTVVDAGLDYATNVRYSYTYEVCFAAGDGLVRYITIDVHTIGPGPIGLLDSVRYELQENIEKWCEESSLGFRYHDDMISVDFYDDTGAPVDLEFEDVDELFLLVTSVRIIYLDCQIIND